MNSDPNSGLRLRPLELDPGSFRDREGRVFHRDGNVYRALSERALTDWRALHATRFYATFTADRRLVQTSLLSASPADFEIGGTWAAMLQHESIPVISYPYEWSFGMLQEAALLQLDLLVAALAEGMILKDSTPYNVQWFGSQPVFIDTPSIEIMEQHQPWVGYEQFCSMFLYPLFFQAYKDIPFQPWLRGSIDGIRADHCASIMSPRDLLRPGVFTHVYLHAKAQRKYSSTQSDARSSLRSIGFNSSMIKNNVSSLRRLVARLRWNPGSSEWSEYHSDCSYSASDDEVKKDFVARATQSRDWKLVWDLGCNIGTFSRIAAEKADYVVALDADHLAVDRLFRTLRNDRVTNVLPLIMNLADPSPDLGWRGQERQILASRGRPDLVLCLALLHHLVISANIPLVELVDWLAELRGSLIIEFVHRNDPMVEVLLKNKANQYADYNRNCFESHLKTHFDVVETTQLSSGSRTLYFARPRS